MWSNDLAEELHAPIRRNFKKRRVIARGVDDIWAIDLIDMQEFASDNNNYKYLLSVIDIVSKYAWVLPLKNKSGIETTKAFKEILSERNPNKVWADDGKEFWNKKFREVAPALYSTQNEEKSCVVERFNRTLKSMIWKYFTANNTRRYVDVLGELVNRYNNTKHSSIKMTPVEAVANPSMAYLNLYDDVIHDTSEIPVPKFHIGDRVRISKKKRTFEKGFTPN